jgi:protein gp37
MGETTEIAWTDATFNPWIGCTNVSPGCDNCYAEAQDHRWGHDRWGKGKPRERTSPANWRKVTAWNTQAAALGLRRRVFCASLADVFDAEVDPSWRRDLFELIRVCPWLDFQLLTKRPQNIRKMLPKDWGTGYPNAWLGSTVEAPRFAGARINALTSVHAAVHFLSVEPQIEPIDWTPWLLDAGNPGIGWIIVGGESGHGARPFHVDWARTTIRQGHLAGAKVFVKQLGRRPMFGGAAELPDELYRLLDANGYNPEEIDAAAREGRVSLADGKGGDPQEWPADLRVREFPEVRP